MSLFPTVLMPHSSALMGNAEERMQHLQPKELKGFGPTAGPFLMDSKLHHHSKLPGYRRTGRRAQGSDPAANSCWCFSMVSQHGA